MIYLDMDIRVCIISIGVGEAHEKVVCQDAQIEECKIPWTEGIGGRGTVNLRDPCDA